MNLNNFNYKLQNIYNLDGKHIGAELLLNKGNLSECDFTFQLNSVMNNHVCFINLLDRLEVKVKNDSRFRNEFYKKKIFVNIDACQLKIKNVLKKINEANKSLLQNNINLIIELTERIEDSDVNIIKKCLKWLTKRGIVTAVDDLNLDYDCRLDLALDGDCEIVKLEWESGQVEKIKDYILKFRNKKIILERVECLNEVISELELIKEIWGIQGFHFCKGKAVQI